MGRTIGVLSEDVEALRFLAVLSGVERCNRIEWGDKLYQAHLNATRLPSIIPFLTNDPPVGYIVVLSKRREDDVRFYSESLKQKPIVIVYEVSEGYSSQQHERHKNVVVVECNADNVENVKAVMAELQPLCDADASRNRQAAPIEGGLFRTAADDRANGEGDRSSSLLCKA